MHLRAEHFAHDETFSVHLVESGLPSIPMGITEYKFRFQIWDQIPGTDSDLQNSYLVIYRYGFHSVHGLNNNGCQATLKDGDGIHSATFKGVLQKVYHLITKIHEFLLSFTHSLLADEMGYLPG